MSDKLGDGDLFELKNAFVLGNYQMAINEASTLGSDLTPAQQLERDVYVYRSYVAQGKSQLVLSELASAPSNNAALLGVRLLAEHALAAQSGQAAAVDAVLAKVKQAMADSQLAQNATLQLLAATIYFANGQLQEAMRCVFQQQSSLEAQALLVQLYLHIDRVELAEKELRQLQQRDDDASIVQLQAAALAVAQGGDQRIADAQSIYAELADKYGATALLLNGQAVCALLQARWADAERLALQALEKNPADGDALINVLCAQQHQAKFDAATRQLAQLRSSHPQHPWLRQVQQAEQSFDQLAANFSISAN